jgi:Flp pilus assembly pilin Flp
MTSPDQWWNLGTLRRASASKGGPVNMRFLSVVRLQAERAQTMAEYAVVLGVISIIVVGAFSLLSTGVASQITNAVSAL